MIEKNKTSVSILIEEVIELRSMYFDGLINPKRFTQLLNQALNNAAIDNEEEIEKAFNDGKSKIYENTSSKDYLKSNFKEYNLFNI